MASNKTTYAQASFRKLVEDTDYDSSKRIFTLDVKSRDNRWKLLITHVDRTSYADWMKFVTGSITYLRLYHDDEGMILQVANGELEIFSQYKDTECTYSLNAELGLAAVKKALEDPTAKDLFG
jgi:hypothetical protein